MKIPIQINEGAFLGAFGLFLTALIVVWVVAYTVKVIRRS